MSAGHFIQTGEPVAFSLHCPDRACAGATLSPVRTDLPPHADEAG